MRSNLSYFSVLHLSANSTQEEVEDRVQDLSEFLTSSDIPAHLQEWAVAEAAIVAEAYAALLDPDEEDAEGEPSEPPLDAPEEYWRPSDTSRSAAAQASRRSGSPAAKIARSPVAVGVVLVLSLLVGVFIGQGWLDRDGGDSAAAGESGAGTVDGLDMARINSLVNAAEEDPANIEALFELGETFFNAEQWQASIDWFTRLLAIDPNNVHARTDIGTSQFNLGQVLEAKEAWESALVLAPDDVQLRYNMGFLYANEEPPDVDSAVREWEKVLELAPGSGLATTVQLHLDGLVEGLTTEEQP